MKILKYPVEQRYWWIFYPTVIAARVRGAFSEERDRLGVIWVRPLGKDEMQQLNKLTGEA